MKVSKRWSFKACSWFPVFSGGDAKGAREETKTTGMTFFPSLLPRYTEKQNLSFMFSGFTKRKVTQTMHGCIFSCLENGTKERKTEKSRVKPKIVSLKIWGLASEKRARGVVDIVDLFSSSVYRSLCS